MRRLAAGAGDLAGWALPCCPIARSAAHRALVRMGGSLRRMRLAPAAPSRAANMAGGWGQAGSGEDSSGVQQQLRNVQKIHCFEGRIY